MRVPYVLWIAWRYMRARGRQSALTITGVALGVMVVAAMQSYMGGFLQYFTERALQSTADITVTQVQPGLPNPAGPVTRGLRALNDPVIEVPQLPIPPGEEPLENPRQVEAVVTRISGVTAVAPFVSGQGIILNGDLRQAVSFLGIRPRQEVRVIDFERNLTAGSAEALATQANGIILGVILAADLSAEVGDRVTVISQEGVSRRFEVVGLYSAQLRDIDQTRAFINLPQAQQLLATRGISGLSVRTASLDDAPAVARRIEMETRQRARTWREQNSGILDLFTTITSIIYAVVGQTMLVAGFGIANTLVLTVNEKRRDIGVLKALGVPAPKVAALFIYSGLLVGIIGVLLGVILGAITIDWMSRTRIPVDTESAPGLVEIETFPMLRAPRVYVISVIFGLLVSLGASVLPSLRAARSDPIQVVREAE